MGVLLNIGGRSSFLPTEMGSELVHCWWEKGSFVGCLGLGVQAVEGFLFVPTPTSRTSNFEDFELLELYHPPPEKYENFSLPTLGITSC